MKVYCQKKGVGKYRLKESDLCKVLKTMRFFRIESARTGRGDQDFARAEYQHDEIIFRENEPGIGHVSSSRPVVILSESGKLH
jgi:hypothetical protein